MLLLLELVRRVLLLLLLLVLLLLVYHLLRQASLHVRLQRRSYRHTWQCTRALPLHEHLLELLREAGGGSCWHVALVLTHVLHSSDLSIVLHHWVEITLVLHQLVRHANALHLLSLLERINHAWVHLVEVRPGSHLVAEVLWWWSLSLEGRSLLLRNLCLHMRRAHTNCWLDAKLRTRYLVIVFGNKLLDHSHGFVLEILSDLGEDLLYLLQVVYPYVLIPNVLEDFSG